MLKRFIQVLVGGVAGSGSLTAGAVIGRALHRLGYHVVGVNEYPSIIRGGHTAYWVRAGVEPVYEIDYPSDYVIALDKATFSVHSRDIERDTVIIYDEESLGKQDVDAVTVNVPFKRIIRENKLNPLVTNMVGVGAAAALMGIPVTFIEKAIEDQFPRGGPLVEMDKKAVILGYEYASSMTENIEPARLPDPPRRGRRVFVTGNEAASLAMVRAGVRFYAAYPMTPASPILHYMARISREKDIIVIQAESEIAAAQMVVGAAWAGVRAATATSGGGFALMQETFSMAGMFETPAVFILAMRAGPSTGMATQNGQADLLWTVFSGHGEFPRIVVAPRDQYEMYNRVIEVFNLAEKYRVPAVIVEDKHLAESHRSIEEPPENIVIDRGAVLSRREAEERIKRGWVFKPYEITETGVSPWVPPGTPGAIVKSESSEHNEEGYVSSHPEIAAAMYEKRMRKERFLRKEIEEKHDPVKTYGDPDKASLTVYTWGSATNAVLEASRHLAGRGVGLYVVQVVYMAPFPVNRFMEAYEPVRGKPSLTVEYNYTGQLGKLIRMETGVRADGHIGKYDGRPFRGIELAEKIASWLRR